MHYCDTCVLDWRTPTADISAVACKRGHRMDELSRRNLVTVAAVTMASTVAFAGASLMSTARAADFPTRAITLVVPYPAGGGVDAMARVVAQKLSDAFRQTVTVDNRGGGGGTTGTLSINPSLYTRLGMDPRKDFAPIGLVASMPVALLAHPSFPAKTVAELIALARKAPGTLNIGTSPVS